MMRKRKIPGRRTAVFRFMERQAITSTKVHHAAEQERAGARRRWIRELARGMTEPSRWRFKGRWFVNFASRIIANWLGPARPREIG